MKKALVFIKNKTTFLGAIITATIVGGATTAVVMAAIPDGNGIIHGCYKNSTGTLKIIDTGTGATCGGGETSLNWNAQNSPGTGAFVSNLSGASLSAADLRYRSFIYANLSNSDLTGSQLSHSDLSHANLSNSNLTSAQIYNVDLSTTNITNVNFTSTMFDAVGLGSTLLTGDNFTDASLKNVSGLAGRDLRPLILHSVHVQSSDLSGVNLSGVEFGTGGSGNTTFTESTILSNANLSGIKSTGGNSISFARSVLNNTNFSGALLGDLVGRADFTSATGSNTLFVNADLRGALFSNANIPGANFSGANLMNNTTYFNTTFFDNTNLTGANFTNANLTFVHEMETATLTGATWSNTTCPDGTNSDNNGGTCIGHLTP